MGFEYMETKVKLTAALDVEEFRACAHRMVDFVADYHRDVETFPVRSQVDPGYLRPLLPAAAPEEPEALEDVLADVQSRIFPGTTHWQSPTNFAYFPANSSTASILGDLLSGALNVIGFSWISSPAATELEEIALDWLGKLLHLPEEFLTSRGGGAIIHGTASEAVCAVMLAARRRTIAKLVATGVSEFEAMGKLTAYVSDQTHCCVQKAAKIAGVSSNLRVISTNISRCFSMAPDRLRDAVARDVSQGFKPFFLCGTLGTTSSTAVDPLPALGDIALEYDMWFHVDAAFAGSACICPEHRHHLRGIEKADSYSMSPHKWLLTNFDCATLWTRSPRSLKLALAMSAEFLRNKATDSAAVVDLMEMQMFMGRRFRSLKLWFVMRLYGASGLRTHIRRHVSHAVHFEGLIAASRRFELVVPRLFSLVCFRLKPESDMDLNPALLEAVNARGECFLTHTVLGDVYTLRLAVGGTRTDRCHIDRTWTVINEEADRLLPSPAVPVTLAGQ